MYPGMCRKIIMSEKNKYNQQLLDKGILIEMGSYGNTLDEVLITARNLGAVLAELMKEGK